MKPYGQTLSLLLTAMVMAACSHVPAEEGAAQPQRARRGAALPLAAGLAAERRDVANAPKKQEEPKLTEKKTEPTELAERKTEETDGDAPGFFARLFGWGEEDKTDTPAAPEQKPAAVQPTPAQQASAHRMLDGADIPAPSPAGLTPGGDDVDYAPAPTRNGLRLGNFAPPEEAASSAENTAPRPNKVELRGLRSPMLNGGTLPMDINGKLTPETHD